MERFVRLPMLRTWMPSIVMLGVLPLLATLGCAASEEDATADQGEQEPGTYWQLLDDSDLGVTLEPWPPRAGAATLRAVATLGDWSEDQILAEQISYRIAEIEDGFDPWTPMARTADSAEERHFEAPITLAPGTWYVQLKVEGSAYDEPLELNDWTVEVD